MRYASVDILRGFTVAIMILVNNPGSWSYVHPWLEHAEWHGCHMADFVFPFFLFIVGLSIVFALSKALDSGADKQKLAFKSIKRGAILFGLGFLLNLLFDFDFEHVRISGVLQRIGIVFSLTALAFIYLSDIQRKVLLVFLLVGYWAVMTLIPVPGLGIASLEKGKDLGAWLDYLLMPSHLWKYSVTWDPEGILSTIPSIASALIGVSAGAYMKKVSSPIKGILLSGLAAIVLSLIWDVVFPMNKSLWTSSFVLFTGGVAMVLLSVSIFMFDVKGISSGTMPFRALGANPLAAYFGSEFLAKVLITVSIGGLSLSEWSFRFFSFVFSPLAGSVVSAFVTVIFWAIISVFLYRRKIFIKI